MRQIIDTGTHLRVETTRGHWTLVDYQDRDLVESTDWCALNDRYVCKSGRLLHREIASRFFDVDGIQVDHENGDGFDNRRANLRPASVSQNQVNCRSRKGATSQYLGVCLFRGKWQADIKKNGKGVYLGRYNTEEEAAKAYDRAAVEMHGDYARLNFP